MLAPEKLSDKFFLSTLATAVIVGSPAVSEASNMDEQSPNTNGSASEGNSNLHEKKPYIYPYQTLKYGQQGSSIEKLQTLLHASGFYNKEIDGIYGPITLASVRKFQSYNGLEITGKADPDTLTALLQENSMHANELTLVGDIGEAVSDIQSRLKELGYYDYTIDGIFGKLTYDAIIQFQKTNDLKIDGIAGPITYSTLFSEHAVAAKSLKKVAHKANGFSVDTTIISQAKKFIGSPYKWGGTSPQGFDCSGYIQYVFEQKGMTLPRTVSEIWDVGKKVSKPSVGDIVFFQTYKSGPSHAGIYLGNNKFIHAGSSDGVKVSDINQSYWSKRYLGAKRIVKKNNM